MLKKIEPAQSTIGYFAQPYLDMSKALLGLHRNTQAALTANRALRDGLLDSVRRQNEIMSDFVSATEVARRELLSLEFGYDGLTRRHAITQGLIEKSIISVRDVTEIAARLQVDALTTLRHELEKAAHTERVSSL